MKRHLSRPALWLVLVSLGLLAPAHVAAQSSDNESLYRQLALFGDVLEPVRSKYVEAPSDEELIEAALSGMLSSLDPHSS